MDIILLLAIGLLAGAVARRMVSWRQSADLGITLSIGIVGAFTGALLGRLVGYREGAPVLFVASMLGALLVASVYCLYSAAEPSDSHPPALDAASARPTHGLR